MDNNLLHADTILATIQRLAHDAAATLGVTDNDSAARLSRIGSDAQTVRLRIPKKTSQRFQKNSIDYPSVGGYIEVVK